MLEKLYKYIGKNIKNLIDRSDEPYCLRLHSNRVYYVRESLMRRATNVSVYIKYPVIAKRSVQLLCAHSVERKLPHAGRQGTAGVSGTMYRQTYTLWQI